MTFDFCVINPPYNYPNGQSALHYEFLISALGAARRVICLQPWFLCNTLFTGRLDEALAGRGGDIELLAVDKTEHLFKKAVLGFTLSISDFGGRAGIKVDWGTGYTTEYPDTTVIDPLDKYPLLRGIIEKAGVFGAGEFMYKKLYGSHVYGDNRAGWSLRLCPIKRGNRRSYHAYTRLLGDSVSYCGYPGGLCSFYACFDTEKEARNCQSYLESDIIRAYSIAYRRTQDNTRIFKFIPWPAGGFNTDPDMWTNKALSNRAGLTGEERRWLAETLPDCYNVR